MKTILRLGALGTGGTVVYPLVFANTEFHFQKTKDNELILADCMDHLRQYRPSFHLPGGALQSIWNAYGIKKHDRKIPIQYERDYVVLNDGGRVAVDWAYPPEGKSPEGITKVCFVFPGLSGGSDKGYVKSLVKHLTEHKGYIVGVFMNRGVNQEYTSATFPDLTSKEEIEKSLNLMVNKFKDRPNVHFVGMGMSMGANLMMKAAGEQ